MSEEKKKKGKVIDLKLEPVIKVVDAKFLFNQKKKDTKNDRHEDKQK